MEHHRHHYLIFGNHGSWYAVAALNVLETIRLPAITPVEEVPPYIAGVINYRGRIIPVMDLNVRFGRVPERFLLSDSVVVMEAGGRQTGLIVTEACDVVAIPPEELTPTPYPAGDDPEARFVAGEAGVEAKIVMVLDHEKLCGSMELPHLSWEEAELDSGAAWLRSLDFTPEELHQFRRRAQGYRTRSDGHDADGGVPVAVVALSGEFFGLDLTLIREFSPILSCTPIPDCPEQIVGAMNIRGGIITLLDIRPALEMPVRKFSGTAKVAVINRDGGDVGIVVDDIIDIMTLAAGDITPLPAAVTPAAARHAVGVAEFGDRSMMLLGLGELLSGIEDTAIKEESHV